MSLTKSRITLDSGIEATMVRLDASEAEVLSLFAHKPVGTIDRLNARMAKARGFAGADRQVANLHALRLAAGELDLDEVLINGGYFLFNALEIGPFDHFGDPIGLSVTQGEVESPPLFGRATLIRTDQHWAIRKYDSNDCQVMLPSGKIATRCFFADTHPLTPEAEDGMADIVVRGRYVSDIRSAAPHRVPVSGCIIRMARADAPARGAAVSYRLNESVQSALQAGPALVAAGLPAPLSSTVFARERLDGIAPPWGWHANWHNTRAARLAAGIDRQGHLFVCAVEGGSAIHQTCPTEGATLADMAILMLEQGAIEAVNLDGGGSVQVFGAGAGSFLKTGEVYADALFDGATYERSVPTAMKLRLRPREAPELLKKSNEVTT